MLVAALSDLQWRRRRVLIAIVGTGLVFGMTLLMTGVSRGFDAEASATVRDLGAERWIVREGAAGPFLGASPMSQDEATYLAALPGIEAAGPLVFTRKSVNTPKGGEVDVNIMGSTAGRPGMPAADEGRPPTKAGEVMVSSRLEGYRVGDTLTVAGTSLLVVGRVTDSTALAGTPNVFVDLADAQRIGFAGLPVVSSVAVVGEPSVMPEGFQPSSNAAARADLLRAIAKAKSSLTMISVLLWLVAASIIGAVVYLSALERQRDFAVFKATGVATRSILAGMVLQAAVLAVVAAVLGSIIGSLIGPRFPMIVSLELRAHLTLPLVAVGIGVLSSAAGLRRIARIDPALAFGGP